MKDDRAYLQHILAAISRIEEYTSGGELAFAEDARTQDAVIRNLEIIGEAVKNLSEGLKTSQPDVPWKRIAGMRDLLIHAYFGVNIATVWETVSTQIPPLKAKVSHLLMM